MMTEENTSPNHEEADPCPECAVDVGVGLALRICDQAEIDVKDIKQEFLDQKITVQEALDQMKERVKDDEFTAGLLDEVETVMRETLPQNPEALEGVEVIKPKEDDEMSKKRAAFCFISGLKQKEMTDTLASYIKDREKILEGAAPEFAEGTQKVITHLKAAKKAIEELPPCETG